MKPSFFLTLAVGALVLGACSDDATPASDHDAGSIAFSDIHRDILFKRCADAVCHGGGAGMLDLTTPEKAYSALVGVTAAGPDCKSSGLTRVVPGKPENSLLYEKVGGTPSCGRRMPLGSELDADSIARIELWIERGALED